MIGQKLKILFKQDKAYLTTNKPMSFTQLDLPEVAKCFKFPAYWIVEVLNYIESEKKLLQNNFIPKWRN